MTFKTHCEIVKGRIDPAPMVNIVFLLLIFMVLTAPYVVQSGIAVDLPVVKFAPAASYQGLVVTVTRDDLLFFNDQVTTMDALRQSLQEAARKARGQELIIKADGQVSHGTIVQIMSMAMDAGISAVNLATRPGMSAQTPPR
jgi:biopolymer transport protein ExbD